MVGFLAWAISQTIIPTASLPPSPVDPCLSFDKATRTQGSASKMWTIEDQLRMADFGSGAGLRGKEAIGISPDGKHAAFIVYRANPEENAYCQRLMISPLDGEGHAVEAARGGEFIRDDFSLRDFTAVAAGWSRANTPRWSPDGRKIAYLRREDASTQVWLVDPSGDTPPVRATNLPNDVDEFAWSPDGSGFIARTRPGIRLKAEEIARESRTGFLFDERFAPQVADRPIPTGEVERVFSWVELGSDSTRPATEAEVALLDPSRAEGVPPNARQFHPGGGRYSAWLEAKFPERLLSPTRIVMTTPDGTRKMCESAECEGINLISWSERPKSFFMVRRGWGDQQTALIRWNYADLAPTLVTLTNDVLTGCSPAGSEFICVREGVAQPGRLVAINMFSGTQRLLYAPNPEAEVADFGSVERFQISLKTGAETWADLVLPPDHEPGDKHPLVVVQYRSSGFLRGGTGDEVPIHPLAARGFAVLSFNRPDLPSVYLVTNDAEFRTLNDDNWADRKNILAGLELAVQRAIETGAVDERRMGISGFSDGNGTVQFALINSDLFRAASIGSCCEDLYSYVLAAGPRFTDYLRAQRYPYFERGIEEFMKPISLILNVDKIDVPILIQSSDSEYEGGLDVFEVYSHWNKPIEMYVFENETHVKWQPSHREAMYKRSVEWFEFWLASKRNCDPSRDEQYERWLAMSSAPGRGELICAAPY